MLNSWLQFSDGTHEMPNPWFDLPAEGSEKLVLPMDEPYVDAHNRIYKAISKKTAKRKEKHTREARKLGEVETLQKVSKSSTYKNVRIDTTELPEPFGGRRDADVVILLANPKSEVKVARRPNEHQRGIIREGLVSPEGGDFFAITDEFKGTGAYDWWYPKLADLVEKEGLGVEKVSKSIQTIELHGYHSLKFVSPMVNFPSQAYQFQLVRQAIQRGALIVIPWTVNFWQASVPELADPELLAEAKCEVVLGKPPYRRAGLTETLLEDGGYDRVVQKLKSHRFY